MAYTTMSKTRTTGSVIHTWNVLQTIFLKKNPEIFNSSFRYIVDVLSLNKSRFDDYLYLIYPNELEVMDTINTSNVFFLPWHWIDGRLGGRLKTKIYGKPDGTFISCNIPAYGVAQPIRYSRVHAQYSDFLVRAELLIQKLIKQGYVSPMLKWSL